MSRQTVTLRKQLQLKTTQLKSDKAHAFNSVHAKNAQKSRPRTGAACFKGV